MTGPITARTPQRFDAPLPPRTEVVVIGGGIIGVMTVWELARAGVPCVLLEKGRIAGEQSSRNWGWIRAQGRDIAELPIMLDAQAMWPGLAAEAGDIGLAQTGTLYLAQDDAALARYRDWLDQAAPYQVSSRILSADQVAAQLPGAARRWAGALYTPTDYRAEPWVTVPRFAQAAVAAGATIIEDCAVRTLDLSAGRVAGVVTENGTIACGSVVLAGGAWSSLFLRNHGVTIPQLSVRATVAATVPMGGVNPGGAVDDRLAWRKRADGGFSLAPSGFHELFIGPDAFRAFGGFARQLLADPLGTSYKPFAPKGYPDAWGTPRRWSGDTPSPFEAMRVLDPRPHAGRVARLARDFAATFPGLGGVRIAQAWAGMIDVMPDVVPVVDHVAAIPGLTVCTGMCGHGFGIGPAMGRIAARLAQDRSPGHDLTRFRLSRFSDGSRLVLGPNL
ncbi:FAD-binding oxidoreductase [Loktanella sp. SALINAS62]|uniref:NAD(P)/FAD-dependent oxidoreductase n=1 Tax=Loktanella sp. SALINAS62 TaxID=2706124 RepID=UPI001B8D4448|nr:FAD-binding oxidoreductase [Loktanella sp. SALINAS62]MBS1304233.1 FAD-binding oxidoreductase [Loktanella sp. SALINAS62]